VLVKLKTVVRNLRREIRVCALVLRDPRTPWLARILLGAALAYAVSPIDLIPDFLPVVGHLDDAVIVPLLIVLGLALVPKGVVLDHKERVRRSDDGGQQPDQAVC
jgi:uncharacterized membrane protein YkvA (DUF1232 family)